MIPAISHIGIVGYGNVGSHLARILSRNTDANLTIYNRSKIPRDQTISNSRITFTRDIKNLEEADFILLSVSDDAIGPVLKKLRDAISTQPIVVHTAGSIPSDILESYFDRYGVLYPLQTFSKTKELDDIDFPVFVTGSDPVSTEHILSIAQCITSSVHEIDDNQRLGLHVAAVFTSNYTNAMYSIGHQICVDHRLDFKFLLPLIEESAEKVRYLDPPDAQTGPAVRGDLNVIQKHRAFLKENHPQFRELYDLLAHFINKNL